MKLYEARDTADLNWKAAAAKLKKRQRTSQWLKTFSGRKFPYAAGLIDMAIGFAGYQWFVEHPEQWEQVASLVNKVL